MQENKIEKKRQEVNPHQFNQAYVGGAIDTYYVNRILAYHNVSDVSEVTKSRGLISNIGINLCRI